MPISAAVAKQLDSVTYLEMTAFVHVCMNVPEVPGGTCTSSSYDKARYMHASVNR